MRQWHPTPVLLSGKSHGWRAAVRGVATSRTRLSDFTFTFQFHALEKEMETHSSVLAWRIPGTAEPGGLPSMGSQSQTSTELNSISSKFGKLSSGCRAGKGQFSFQFQRKSMQKNVPATAQLHSISHASKVMLKILQARLQ